MNEQSVFAKFYFKSCEGKPASEPGRTIDAGEEVLMIANEVSGGVG